MSRCIWLGFRGALFLELLLPPELFLKEGLAHEMIAFLEDDIRLRQNGIVLEVSFLVSFLQLLVLLNIVLLEFFKIHLQCPAQFDSDLLLLLKDNLVVLHVLLRVRLQVRSQLVQIQAVLVRTFLSAEKELAELGCAKGSADKSLVVHELVNGEYSFCAVSRVVESDVAGV